MYFSNQLRNSNVSLTGIAASVHERQRTYIVTLRYDYQIGRKVAKRMSERFILTIVLQVRFCCKPLPQSRRMKWELNTFAWQRVESWMLTGRHKINTMPFAIHPCEIPGPQLFAAAPHSVRMCSCMIPLTMQPLNESNALRCEPSPACNQRIFDVSLRNFAAESTCCPCIAEADKQRVIRLSRNYQFCENDRLPQSKSRREKQKPSSGSRTCSFSLRWDFC